MDNFSFVFLSRYTCTRFCSSFFPFFWHHSITDKAEVKKRKKILIRCKILVHIRIFANIALPPKAHCFTPHIRRKRIILLFLWICCMYTTKSAQFYSAFSPTTISLTPHFRQKREVCLRFFAEKAQNDPKMLSYKDNAKFNSMFSVTTLSYASCFQRKRGVIENFEYSIWANLKISENAGCTAFCIYSISDWKMQYKV